VRTLTNLIRGYFQARRICTVGDLIGISHRSNLHRLPNPVPNRINDCDIYCLILKVRREAAAAKQRLGI
jgi:hypothetical protein